MANPDSTLLSWIAAEVNQALSVVREHVAKFCAAPGETAALAPCHDHLHQVSGALRMVGLGGATRFCESLESGFAGLKSAKPTMQTMALLDRAVLALKEFVEGLERGQPNVPLRLYPVYSELATLQGKSEAAEKDLFYPDLSVAVPANASAKSVAKEEIGRCLQTSRAQFQRGLLGWLRGSPRGLDEMGRALDLLDQVAAQLPEPRALWWVAQAFVELLGAERDTAWLTQAKGLCNRIDFHMRDLAAGARGVNETLLRELLYALAKSRASAPLANQVRGLYQLDSLFPVPQPVSLDPDTTGEWLEAALYDLHSRLEALKSSWVHYVGGEQKSAARFRELVASFKTKAAELGNQHLIKLLDAIALVSKHLPDPYPAREQYMVIEMASAFLLVENVIDNFTNPPQDLDGQIVLLGGWLLDSAKGKSNGAAPAGLRADLVQQIGALQLRAQVAKEIAANLQHIEQGLDAFARDPARRDAMTGVKPHLRQVHGALLVLGFLRAAEVILLCENMIEACEGAEPREAAEELDWIAEGLSSVGFFLGPCMKARDPAEQAIDLFFQRFGKRAVNLEPAKDEAPQAAVSAPRPGVDKELLSIFLEEAVEVLKGIKAGLPRLRAKPEDHETLTTIRRGFHTLKGSGRMVGLMDLGEIAWEIEQLMNLWLEQRRRATPALLELLAEAAQSFSGWIEALREGRLSGEINAAELVQAARRLKAGEEPSMALPAPVEPEEVTIGGTTLSRAFFEIYIKEAAEHIATLESEFAAWRANPGSETSQSFMRAAHTLASSSGTAGFHELASLAAAIEQWIPFARQVTDAFDAEVLQAAIARLRAMSEAMARRETPAAAALETGRLRELTARLEAKPIESKPSEGKSPAAAPAPAEDERDKRTMRDDIDEQLLPVFLEEAQELVPAIGGDLRDWKANPDDERISQSLRRSLHTLKGSARMAGAIRLGELTHVMESRIDAALEAKEFPPELFTELEEKMDRLSADVERMRAGLVGVAAEPTPQPMALDAIQRPALQQAAAVLRINAEVVDELINDSGEMAIARSRVEAEARAMRHSLAELSESVARLRAQLREVEIQADSQMQSRMSVLEERRGDYDPLEFDRYTRLQELTRLMAETLNDVLSIQQALARSVGETDAALLQQARTSRGVQQDLMRMRTMPFSTLNERLHRVVRQTARELAKQVELEIDGAEVELDRSVLERIGAPLEHMLRNALTHGIEAPAERRAAAKPDTGRIRVTLRQEANEIALTLSDDGAGIDLEKLVAKATAKGLLAAGEMLTDAQRLQLVFASGLSTADTVTELAGRGVGMDVVRNEIAAIGGRIEVATGRGRGTTFSVYLPLTLAVTQALIVRSGENRLALSSAMVEQVLRVKAEAMAGLYSAKELEFQERAYPLFSLAHMLGDEATTEILPYNSVLLLRSGIHRIALHVDELLGNHEIVVKAIGPQLARVAWISGATVLGDGAIVPIINPVVLASRTRRDPAHFEATTLVPPLREAAAPRSNAPLIMVVDDSITVRKVTSRLLEREGYRVATAKDGLDALEQLRETLPAVLLVDIEMPRMDGFDLTRALRGDARTRTIPIIIISSRTAEKHRSQAAALGVNAFLGKPYQEAELLEHLRAQLGAAAVH